ncbi:MAG: AMP-binding protein [Pyrobaculum sp.]
MDIWRPEVYHLERSNVGNFIASRGFTLEDFVKHTYEKPEEFWGWFERHIGLRWARRYHRVLDLGRGPQWPRWFVGGFLNMADQLDDVTAPLVIWEGEGGETQTWSYGRTLYLAKAVASWLKKNGLQKGDRVAVYMPMVPEIVPVMLGIIRAGGIFVPLFSGFGREAIRVRLEDSQAKFVFASDVSYRRGKEVDMLTELEAAVPRDVQAVLHSRSRERPYVDLRQVFKTGGDHVEETEAEDPMMLIYTSGTTGRPKATVHVHGGFPIKAAADVYFHFDIKQGDVFTWVTDMGWMMGPWLVFSSYLLKAAMAFFEGAPDHPKERLWAFVERNKVKALGMAATLSRHLRAIGAEPSGLDHLEAFGNTGEPIDLETWLWLHKAGRGRIPIINYSGGTEISGGIVGCYVVKPIKPTSFNGASPGIHAAVFTEEGKPAPPGVEGELVVLSVWPGMTRGFWQDPQRYLDTYWSKWPGVWTHGDAAVIDQEGYFYIVGRTDDTIKVAGKRLGPAEIESVLNSHPAVAESAVVGKPDPIKGETPVAFVKLRHGYVATEELKKELILLVNNALGKAFGGLEEIYFVKDLPKTRNAKIMRRVIKAILSNRSPGDLSALENPDAVEEIRRALA